jgi:hypothetical protein
MVTYIDKLLFLLIQERGIHPGGGIHSSSLTAVAAHCIERIRIELNAMHLPNSKRAKARAVRNVNDQLKEAQSHSQAGRVLIRTGEVRTRDSTGPKIPRGPGPL